MSERKACILLLFLSATVACAQVELAAVDPLLINANGQGLVSEWYLDPPAGPGETWEVEAEGWEQVVHRWTTGEGWKLRQEIAVRPDRLEITQLRLLDSNATGVSGAGVVLPLELLDGAQFEVIGAPVGKVERDDRTAMGTLGPDQITRINNVEYLRLHLPGGSVDFDCNPKGTWCPGPGICPATLRFTLIRSDEGWRLFTASGKARVGIIHEFKLVISPALEVPVAEVHPVVNVRWTEPYGPTSLVNIGTSTVDRFTSTTLPDCELTLDERFIGIRDERVEGASIAGGTMVLEIPVERDGVYLVSMLAGDPGREIGPATVSAGVGEPVQTPTVRSGEYLSWALPGRAIDGTITVTISGNARICAAVAAPMMFANEDYHLERDWWVSTEFHPEDDLPL